MILNNALCNVTCTGYDGGDEYQTVFCGGPGSLKSVYVTVGKKYIKHHKKSVFRLACLFEGTQISKFAELQIRVGLEDNPKLFFLISQQNIYCDPSLEPSRRDGSHDESQNMFKWRNMAKYP